MAKYPARKPDATTERRLRKTIWERDNKQCVRCGQALLFREARLDRIRQWDNSFKNLRTLCRRCYVLRICHNGGVAKAIEDGIVPWDWRPLVWE